VTFPGAGEHPGRRVIDVAVSVTALVLLAVPLALAALLVKLSSAGPIFFRQRRVGRYGRPFSLYKFRSMRMAPRGPAVTSEGDPRVTGVGAFLRRWKIDELPQLWNVLRGDMSLLGPRPELAVFVEHYTPAERRILEVTPGLAGMAQLLYPHEAALLRQYPEPERAYLEQLLPGKIAADLAYERRRSAASDFHLLIALLLLIAGVGRYADTALDPPRGDRWRREGHPASGLGAD
jgi:lipopolysaccharide/colanic/teichoic acid biosynthesis glycosyltransferase